MAPPDRDIYESSPEVLGVKGELVTACQADLDDLIRRAGRNPRGRARLLLHPDSADSLHEMLIVLKRPCYIRPHRTDRSSKTYHVVMGTMAVVVFEDDGTVRDCLLVGAPHARGTFSVRLMQQRFHTVLPVTRELAYFEVVPGPWVGTTYADWAPEEDAPNTAEQYFRCLWRTLAAREPQMQDAEGFFDGCSREEK